MSHINRTEGIFRGLRIHNKDNNVLEMNQTGNYRLSSKNITNYSSNSINSFSDRDIIYRSNNNLILNSKNGNIVIRNGNEINSSLFNYDNNYNGDIEEPPNLKSQYDIDTIKNDSLLIESLERNKNICLLSNNGINQISHGNINLISDSNINIKSHKNVNLNSYESIILNSERFVSTVEDDIILLSSHGEIKLGGDGINNVGLKVNSNCNKNYVSIGNINEYAHRNLHINVKDSLDDNNKNGILIKSEDKNNIYPDITFENNSDGNLITNLSIGIGDNLNNNIHFVKKINKNGETFLKSLDDYQFSLKDINKEIIYEDKNFKKDIIKSLTKDKNIVLLNNNISDAEVKKFNYQKCYIKNSNNAYLKTNTSSDLKIGVNNSNIININNNNNVGINNNNPSATLDISNKVGEITNIRLDKDKKYINPKGIQMKNGNSILFCNTQKNNLFNLEAFIYSDNNFIISFIIYENSHSFIDYDVDNLCSKDDNFGIVFNFFNGLNYITESKIYNNNGNLVSKGYSFSHKYLEINSSPKIKSFILDMENKIKKSGYLIAFRDMTIEGDIISEILLFDENYNKDFTQSINLKDQVNTFFEKSMDLKNNGKIIKKVNHKFINIDYNINYNSFIVNISCEMIVKSNLNNSEDNMYFSLLNEIFIDLDNFKLDKIVKLNMDDIFQYKIGKDRKIDGQLINMGSLYEIYQCETLLLNKNSGLFKICYYLRDCKKNKIINLITETYKSNNSSNEKFSNFKIIDNIEIEPNNVSPFISHINDNHFIVAYQSKNDIKYYSNIKNDITNLDLEKCKTPYLIKLKNNHGIYLSTLLLYENYNEKNIYNFGSINFIEIESDGYIFKIKNKKNYISVKNNGNINLNNQIEINKEKDFTKINNLVINSVNFLPKISSNGQINIWNNEIYIYLNEQWKKIQLL